MRLSFLRGAIFLPIGAKMELTHQIIQFFDRIGLRRGVQVSVCPEGRLDVLVAESLADQEDRTAQVDQQRGMGVPEVMQADRLHPGQRRRAVELPAEEVLRIWEKPVVRLGLIESVHVFEPFPQKRTENRIKKLNKMQR